MQNHGSDEMCTVHRTQNRDSCRGHTCTRAFCLACLLVTLIKHMLGIQASSEWSHSWSMLPNWSLSQCCWHKMAQIEIFSTICQYQTLVALVFCWKIYRWGNRKWRNLTRNVASEQLEKNSSNFKGRNRWKNGIQIWSTGGLQWCSASSAEKDFKPWSLRCWICDLNRIWNSS